MPCIVVSSLAGARVAHDGPFEHTSTLKMIETIFGLKPLTARDANAMNLAQVLNRHVTAPVPQSAVPEGTARLGRSCGAASGVPRPPVAAVPLTRYPELPRAGGSLTVSPAG